MKRNQWISVNDRLPEKYNRVLVRYADGMIDFGYYDKDSFHSYKVRDDELWFNVTHWTPIPEFKIEQ